MATRTTLFLDKLRQLQLLESRQLEELAGATSRWEDTKVLARELVARQWLTPFQVNQVLKGRGADLSIGAYLVLERLGEGGTGEVFKARHRRMQRLVALKLIRRELLTDPEVVQRFLREIQVVSQLSHPNVVHAYDAGPIGSTYFLAMEFIEGTDLSALVKKSGVLPVPRACDYLRQAADGLQHAYERGLIHRDIKPPNFLLMQPGRDWDCGESTRRSHASPWGLIKLLDLGLARLHRTVDGERTSMLTPTGPMMMGTPDYLAPEQALDFHNVDIRADIYGLGCTAFYLLTGQPPFPGGTLAQKLLRHQQIECPAVEVLRPDVPPELAALLRRMLAKSPDDRPQTPRAVADELAHLCRHGRLAMAMETRDLYDRTLATSFTAERVIAATPQLGHASPVSSDGARAQLVEVRRPPRLSSRRPRLLLAALVLLGLGSLPAALVIRRESTGSAGVSEPAPATEPKAPLSWKEILATWNDPHSPRESLRPALLRCLQTQPGTPQAEQAAAMLRQLRSPLDSLDRKAVAPERLHVGHPRELVALVGKPRAQAGPHHVVAFSADGLWLADGGEDGKVRVWRVQDFVPLPTLSGHANPVRAIQFAPDGLSLTAAGVTDPVALVWDLSGAAPRERARLTGHTGAIRSIAYAPDGKTLATAGIDSTVRLWDLTRRTCPERSLLRGHKESVLGVAFSPDGRSLASTGADQTIRLWRLSREVVEANTLLPGLTGDNARLAFLPDGKGLIATGGGTSEWALRVGEITGETPRVLWGVKKRNIPTIALSPDGLSLAVCYGNGELSLYDPQTGFKRHEWHWPHAIHSLDFAPDGRHLAVATTEGAIAILRFASPPAAVK